jgi:hypothetical protein
MSLQEHKVREQSRCYAVPRRRSLERDEMEVPLKRTEEHKRDPGEQDANEIVSDVG